MGFTFEQEQAIVTMGKNILVAAAAGSGKTEILTSRIKNIILHEDDNIKTDIDRMLVLTFTNEAAAEMKQRVASNIRDEIKKNPYNRAYLQKQLSLMMDANISTFHSFAQKIIKKYFYKVGIDPKVKVIDEAQGIILKKKAIDETFSSLFIDENEEIREAFKTFLKKFSSAKNENKIKNEILQFYDKLMAFPNPFSSLEEAVINLRCDDEGFIDFISNEAFSIAKEGLESLLYYKLELNKFLEEVFLVNSAKKHSADIQNIESVLSRIDKSNFFNIIKTDLANEKGSIKLTSIAAGAGERDSFKMIKDELSAIKDKISESKSIVENILHYDNLENAVNEIKDTYDTGNILKEIILRFHKEYRLIKDSNKSIDFSDIEHLAIELLSDKSIADEYREKFKYIFIDEYQDTNDIQEYIISLIKREDNLFMVGDIKQSIYRFRLAEPEIFQSKYRNYIDFQDKDSIEDCIKIDLNKNFRSKEEVINYVNSVFKVNMEGYDEKAQLNCGIQYESVSEEDGFLKRGAKLLLINKETKEHIKDIDNIKEIEASSYTAEAMSIASEIKEIIGKLYIDKNGNKRSLSYKDIVVLTKSRTAHKELKLILEKSGIPVSISDNKGYFDKVEIQIILDILKVIQNRNQDIPFIGVLTNWIFNFSPTELSQIRLNCSEGRFTSAFKEYIKSGTNQELINKCNEVDTKIRKWRKDISRVSLEAFLWDLINSEGIYQHVLTLSSGNQRQVNIRAFIEKVKSFESFSDGGLPGLLAYIENLKKEDVKVGEAKTLSDKDDVVKIMTIHGSKGKQFPVVFLANTHGQFRSASNPIGNYFFLSKQKALYIKNVSIEDGIRTDNILKTILSKNELDKNIEEEKRVLYVAMTRPRDKLIISGVVDNFDIVQNKIDYDNTQLGYIANSLDENLIDIENIENLNKELFTAIEEDNPVKSADYSGKDFSLNDNDIERILSFEYKYKKDTETKSKYSVSELNSTNVTSQADWDIEETFFKDSRDKHRKLSSAEIGNIYHSMMEEIDFEEYREKGYVAITESLKMLNSISDYDDKIEDIINIDKIVSFFKSDLGIRALDKKVFKEKTFRMLYDIDGGETIVQGIIDCYFEDDDGELVLIDYKSNRFTEFIEEKYKMQMKLYKTALEKATGKNVKETWLYLFSDEKAINVSV